MTGEELIARWREDAKNYKGNMLFVTNRCADELAAALPEIERRARLLTVEQVEKIHAIIENYSTDVVDYELATDDINAALTQPVPATKRILKPGPYKPWCEEHRQAPPCLFCDYTVGEEQDQMTDHAKELAFKLQSMWALDGIEQRVLPLLRSLVASETERCAKIADEFGFRAPGGTSVVGDAIRCEGCRQGQHKIKPPHSGVVGSRTVHVPSGWICEADVPVGTGMKKNDHLR